MFSFYLCGILFVLSFQFTVFPGHFFRLLKMFSLEVATRALGEQNRVNDVNNAIGGRDVGGGNAGDR
jgi:multisubunit Na+/H+ antiporter MnhB subunit